VTAKPTVDDPYRQRADFALLLNNDAKGTS